MIKPSAEGYHVRGAFNPGAVQFGDEILLLLRVAEDCPAAEGEVAVPKVDFIDGKAVPSVLRVKTDDPDVELKDTRGVVYKGKDYLSTMSHIRLARSTDGVNFTVDDTPFLFASSEEDMYGVEDARVVKIEDTYYINYTCVSADGWATALASTKDFKVIERHGIIFHPENKDVSIFPEKVNGKYCALHRPNNSGFGKPSVWYAESPDLLHWGNHKCILRPRDTKEEALKIGGGAPSLKTPDGWLHVYHAKGEGQVYSLYVTLLDLNQPWKVLKRSTQPLLSPEAKYETDGFFPNVIFTNGQVAHDDGRISIYYGAADETTCLFQTDVNSLIR